mmetsp:Transcript_1575/g.2985  ORF Transcript_1575/g.2985 Transcript_1575/m.2985 type:complete len:92 (-) Transcript_1575:60-335(-)
MTKQLIKMKHDVRFKAYQVRQDLHLLAGLSRPESSTTFPVVTRTIQHPGSFFPLLYFGIRTFQKERREPEYPFTTQRPYTIANQSKESKRT